MLIRDLEGKTGLDRATIRYYEREGLIAPERKENGYRIYSDDDCKTLQKVKFLRQLGMSLVRIKALQKGSADLQAVLSEQITRLNRQIRDAERAKRVCIQMQIDGVSFGNLNVDHYQNFWNTQPALPPQKAFKEPVYREYHPVLRFLARWLDYCLVGNFLQFVFTVILGVRPYSDWLANVIGYAAPFLMVPIGALMLHFWGSTPGKWCLGLEVESENGGKLSYASALEREWNVLRYGYGFGIPIWMHWRLYRSYREYQEQDPDWDWDSEYSYHPWENRRKAATVGLILAVILMITASINFQFQPKHKGDLTVAEFASNYNHFVSVLNPEYDQSLRLLPDGNRYPASDNTVVIYPFGQPEKERYSFDYVLEGERIKEIRYSNRWTSVFYIDSMPAQCQYAAITAVMSQPGTSKRCLTEFASIWDAEISKESGEITYAGVRIYWNIEAVNCVRTADGSYITQDDSKESWMGLDFQIEMN